MVENESVCHFLYCYEMFVIVLHQLIQLVIRTEAWIIKSFPYLIAHNFCEVFKELFKSSKLFCAHGNDGPLEELVVVDEKPDLSRPLFGRNVEERRSMRGRRGSRAQVGRHCHSIL